ncbi:MAG: hypothetical protein ABSC25_06275 [Roseiarcus sp.]
MRRSAAGQVWGGRAALAALCVLAAPLALGGCVEVAADLAPSVDAHRQFVRRDGVSLEQASVAIVSVDGAPDAIAASFSQTLAREAQARDIVVVDEAKARYLVRGYLSADLTEDGASIEYVWDVFTADKRRAQRLNDVIAVKGTGDDPWALAGEAALKSVAAKSADDLAAYLSNTPEAVAVAAGAPEPAAAAPLSYAAQ